MSGTSVGELFRRNVKVDAEPDARTSDEDIKSIVEALQNLKGLFYQSLKRRWRPQLFALLAIGSFFLIVRDAQHITKTVSSPLFYEHELHQRPTRASCEARKKRRDYDLDEDAALLTVASSTKDIQPPQSICENLSHGSLTASALWQSHLTDLLQASKHPADFEWMHQLWTKALLDFVHPSMLAKGIRGIPSVRDVQKVLRIIDQRKFSLYKKALNESHEVTPPLYVLVFGGSVPEGTGCDTIPKEVAHLLPKNIHLPKIQGKQCSWPYRLQLLVDHFFGPGVVEIINGAVGGTNTLLPLPVLEYLLYQEGSPLIAHGGPDVVINAYSVNDNLSARDKNTSASDEHWIGNAIKAQAFIRRAEKSRSCREPPVVVFLDEYFGNQNGEQILGDDVRNDAIRLLADMYELLYVSSSYPVKHIPMANQMETVFSPDWFKNSYTRIVNGHFNMPGHLHVANTLAYAALKTAVEYCANEEFTPSSNTFKPNTVLSKSAAETLNMFVLPPKLTQASALSTLPHEWKKYGETDLLRKKELCSKADYTKAPCPFAFVATPAGTARTAVELNKYLQPFLLDKSDNTGWTGENEMRNGWQNKLGLVAKKHGAKILFTLTDLNNSIRFITIHYLRSYGEKWIGSTAQFDIKTFPSSNTDQKPVYETSFEKQGFWEQEFSMAETFRLDLGEHSAKIGDTMTFEVTLTGGPQFKIISLMMCSR
jgi:hypothetical protein